jgi:hypothetical protein
MESWKSNQDDNEQRKNVQPMAIETNDLQQVNTSVHLTNGDRKDESNQQDQMVSEEKKVIGVDGKRSPAKRGVTRSKANRIEPIREMAAQGFRSEQYLDWSPNIPLRRALF